jgi:subtilisin family serine protease
MSPYSSDAIVVGAMDSTVYDATTDQKSVFSNAGPGVDVFAAGSNIMSAMSTTNVFSAVSYHLDSAFRQGNISGTSMASPQIAGITTLFLENNLTATPALPTSLALPRNLIVIGIVFILRYVILNVISTCLMIRVSFKQ